MEKGNKISLVSLIILTFLLLMLFLWAFSWNWTTNEVCEPNNDASKPNQITERIGNVTLIKYRDCKGYEWFTCIELEEIQRYVCEDGETYKSRYEIEKACGLW